MRRLLITGVSGLLGSNVARAAGGVFETYGVYHDHPVVLQGCRLSRVDLRNAAETATVVEAINPHSIIHAAGMTDVDGCEKRPQAAWEANVKASRNVAAAAARVDAKVVFISTDSVFDGKHGDYHEDDAPAPPNVYARTKLEGELEVAKAAADNLIVRTNIFGWNILPKPTLAEWIYRELAAGRRLGGFKDVRFNPLLVNDLAVILFKLIETAATGTFHVGARASVSKLAFARELADIFRLDGDLIDTISLDDVQLEAARPKDPSLNVGKVSAYLGQTMPTVRDGLLRFNELLKSGYVDRLKAGCLAGDRES